MTTVKKRGRPPGKKTAVKANTMMLEAAVSREDARKPKRAKRVSMQQGLKLELFNIDTENYWYCWILDKDGGLERAHAAWYEHHQEDGVTNTFRQSGPYRQYAMKLPMEYKREDDALKAKKNRATIGAQQKLAPHEYVPGAQDGRQHVLERDVDFDPLAI